MTVTDMEEMKPSVSLVVMNSQQKYVVPWYQSTIASHSVHNFTSKNLILHLQKTEFLQVYF